MKGAALLIVLVLAACGPVNPDAAPADIASFRPGPPTLQAGDDLDIRFPQTPELDERQAIRPDGRIAMPLVGDVAAAGLTVPQLRARLLHDYAGQLVRPQLMVMLRGQAARIFITGEVDKPGAEALATPITVAQAVALAGGLKPTAYRSQVLVVRGEQTRVVDLGRVLTGQAPRQDVALQAGDIVYVPRSPIADVDQFVASYIRDVLPVQPSIGFIP